MLRFYRCQLTSNIEKCQFVESKIDDAIFIICIDYAEVHYKFLKLYNGRPTSPFIYLDTNNLYGQSKMEFVPTDIIDWLSSKDSNLDNYSKNILKGYFWKVDLDYPDELYDLRVKNKNNRKNFLGFLVNNYRR